MVNNQRFKSKTVLLLFMSDNHNSNHRRKALIIAFLINTSFIVVELFGAWYSGSLTLLSDALHMITDSSSILLAIVAAYVASKGADDLRTFGYHRVEVMSGIINGLFLIFTVLYIIFSSYQRLMESQAVNGNIVIIIGIAGLLVNLLAAYFLHGHQSSVNTRGAYLHLISDALGSIAAIASGIIIKLTGVYLVDIVFAVIISMLILYSVKDMLKESINILLQGVPKDKDIKDVEDILSNIDGVKEVHHLHLWSINSEKDALSAHIVVGQNTSYSKVLENSLSEVEDYGIDHPTIQIETSEFNEKEHQCYKNNH